MRKWQSTIKHPQFWRFVIEEQILHDHISQTDLPGFYLYVYDEKDIDIYDYLQDDFDTAKSFALRKFQVPEDSWQEV